MPTSARLRIETASITHPDAQRLIAEVQAEYVVRYGGPDDTPIDPVMFEGAQGRFFVGYLGDVPVATGAWRRSAVEALGATRTAEIKRMYVVPPARGVGHARTMLAHLELTAAATGLEALLLETGVAQPEAIGLYESSGYAPVPGFGHYQDSPLSRCFGKRLDAAVPGSPSTVESGLRHG